MPSVTRKREHVNCSENEPGQALEWGFRCCPENSIVQVTVISKVTVTFLILFPTSRRDRSNHLRRPARRGMDKPRFYEIPRLFVAGISCIIYTIILWPVEGGIPQ